MSDGVCSVFLNNLETLSPRSLVILSPKSSVLSPQSHLCLTSVGSYNIYNHSQSDNYQIKTEKILTDSANWRHLTGKSAGQTLSWMIVILPQLSLLYCCDSIKIVTWMNNFKVIRFYTESTILSQFYIVLKCFWSWRPGDGSLVLCNSKP